MVEFTKLELLQKEIRYEFRDNQLLLRALTRSSYFNEYERGMVGIDQTALSTLGDGVLKAILTKKEYSLEKATPSKITKARIEEEKNTTLAAIGRDNNFDLSEYVRFGKGEKSKIVSYERFQGPFPVPDGKEPEKGGETLYADTIEAIIGAAFQDSHWDFNRVESMVLKWYEACQKE